MQILFGVIKGKSIVVAFGKPKNMVYMRILFISGGTYSIKSTPNDLAAIFALRIFPQKYDERSLLRNSFIFRLNHGQTSKYSTYYLLLVYDDFLYLKYSYIFQNLGQYIINSNYNVAYHD